ncbi:unnamed protein product [marine sediment metagenome]|uniref:Uncharacterized protein n=1 Tax=marine sediment metagenome TaxID=412755 RepID=X0SKD8_9ZZZZ
MKVDFGYVVLRDKELKNKSRSVGKCSDGCECLFPSKILVLADGEGVNFTGIRIEEGWGSSNLYTTECFNKAYAATPNELLSVIPHIKDEHFREKVKKRLKELL